MFEDLIRCFNEQANETAGDYFTPREVIRLMVDILFANDDEFLSKPGVIRTLLDPACVGKMPDMQFNYWEHTNGLVPLFAKGACSELFAKYATHTDPVRGRYIDDTDIFKVMREAAGLPH